MISNIGSTIAYWWFKSVHNMYFLPWLLLFILLLYNCYPVAQLWSYPSKYGFVLVICQLLATILQRSMKYCYGYSWSSGDFCDTTSSSFPLWEGINVEVHSGYISLVHYTDTLVLYSNPIGNIVFENTWTERLFNVHPHSTLPECMGVQYLDPKWTTAPESFTS